MAAIPEEWIKRYVDQWLEIARILERGPMYESALLRADHAMDLVKAWRSRHDKAQTVPADWKAKQAGE